MSAASRSASSIGAQRRHERAVAADHLGLGPAHHQAQQPVQGDKVAAQGVVGFFGVDDMRQVERINAGGLNSGSGARTRRPRRHTCAGTRSPGR